MDGEHIEMIIGGWSSSSLREQALSELASMRDELAVLRQQVGGLTPRAADVANVTAVSVSCPRCGLTFSEPLDESPRR